MSGTTKRGDSLDDSLDNGTFELTLETGLPVAELERRAALAHRGGEICSRALAFYLHDMQRRGVHQQVGFASAVHFAMNRLGMSKGRARELVATGHRLQDLPVLDEAFAKGEVSWSKIRRVARVATPDTEQVWLEGIRGISHREVDALVGCALEGELPRRLDEGLPRLRFTVRFTLSAVQHEMVEQAREKLAAELGRAVDETELLDQLVRLFLSSDADGTVPGRKPVDGSLFRVVVQTPTTSPGVVHEHEPVLVSAEDADAVASDAEVTPRLRQHVLDRDGHRCQSCGALRSLMLHHVIWRDHWGGTYDGNLVTLCARCHALVHELYLFVSGVPGEWVFRDRDGRALTGSLPERRAQLRMCAAAHATARPRHTVLEDLALEDLALEGIPDQIDADWWRKHEHLIEWAPGGRRIRLRRGVRSRSSA